MQAPHDHAPDLVDQVAELRKLMLQVHYFSEAHWLDLALLSSEICRSESGRTGLAGARVVARQFGFPLVAEWIATDVLGC